MKQHVAPAPPASTGSPQGLDLAARSAYLERDVSGVLEGPLTGRLIAGGRANLTYLVTDGMQEWVVRRPPLGHVLETAHDMGREHRVMAALHGSDVPVPEMLALCRDPDILGASFYVMSFVDGTVCRTQDQLAEVSPTAAEELADGLIDVLARLHAVDPRRSASATSVGQPATWNARSTDGASS